MANANKDQTRRASLAEEYIFTRAFGALRKFRLNLAVAWYKIKTQNFILKLLNSGNYYQQFIDYKKINKRTDHAATCIIGSEKFFHIKFHIVIKLQLYYIHSNQSKQLTTLHPSGLIKEYALNEQDNVSQTFHFVIPSISSVSSVFSFIISLLK